MPVHRSIGLHPAVASGLHDRLHAEIDRLVRELEASTDWNDFLGRRGMLLGLRTALELLEYVEGQLHR